MPPKVINCTICNRVFSKRFSLNRHMFTMHQITPVVARRSIMCPIEECESRFPYQGPLRSHLKDAHEITLEDTEISFSSMEEFFEWKRREEKSSSLKYVKACGTQRLMGGTEVYRFNCFRTGMYNPEGKGLRKLKAQGSCKIGASCPSTITAHRHVCGKVTATYCITHVGHQDSESAIKRLSLVKSRPIIPDNEYPSEEVSSKASKQTATMVRNSQLFLEYDVSTEDQFVLCSAISQNKGLDELFDVVRKLVFAETDREYDELVNVLKNITNYSRLNDTDFQQLTDQCNASEDVPVIFYDNQVIESDDETIEAFILVVMNSYQIEILKVLGPNSILCVDPVYSIDDTGYIAISLYVWSSQCGWLLCSICFCQNFNFATMKAFFNQIHIRVGRIQVKTLITEDVDLIHSAWVSVMGLGAEWILAPWHIDYKLRSKLRTLIFTDYVKLACLYRLVRSLIETTNEEKFDKHLSFLSRQSINNTHVANFNKFLVDSYVWRKYSWAKYCRSQSERNALCLAEAAHLFSRRICHGEDLNLGQTLFTMFQYYREKCLKFIKSRHVTLDVETIICPDFTDLGNVYVTPLDSGKEWTIQIGDGTFNVFPTGNKCLKTCSSRCAECRVCVHKYNCSCAESVIQWKFCRHIHFIGRHCIKDENEESEDDENVGEEPAARVWQTGVNKEESIELQLDQNHQEPATVIEFDSETNDVNVILAQIQTLNHEISNCAKNLKNVENLKSVHKELFNTLNLANSLSEEEKQDGKLITLEDHNYTL